MRLIDVDALSADLESLETILSKEGWGLVKAVIDRIHRHKAVEVPRWIPVEEGLPDDGARVIAYYEGHVFDCECDKEQTEYGESPLGWWRLKFDPVTLGVIDSEWVPADATHWMPLQAPPEAPYDDS